MPTIGNVKHGSSLTPNFFRSKVGLGHRFQYGDHRRRDIKAWIAQAVGCKSDEELSAVTWVKSWDHH